MLPTVTSVHILCKIRWECTHPHAYSLVIAPPLLNFFLCWSFPPPGLREEWKRNKATEHIMKTEDAGNQRWTRTGVLFRLSGSNYSRKGRRTWVQSHSLVTLVGLILLAILPFGASIKQSVPRVKLSYKGKKWWWLLFSVRTNFI